MFHRTGYAAPTGLLYGIAGLLAVLAFGGPWLTPCAAQNAAPGRSKIKDNPVQSLIGKKSKGTLDYPTVGDDVYVDGTLPVKVEGIGLVIGLNGTGGNPPPNQYRKEMLEEMKRMEIHRPGDLLASKDTALVLLRAYVPAGVRKGDHVDVEVWVPPGDSTTSLKGGRLLEAGLKESLFGRGKGVLKGKQLLKVAGPLVVQANPSNPDDRAALLKGKILGQSVCLVDRNFRFVLGPENRSGDRTRMLAYYINERFFEPKATPESGVAKAKDDKLIELRLPDRYRHDIHRFLLVARKIPTRSGTEFRETLIEDLKDSLQKPETAIDAAIRLEAIGPGTVPALSEGLKSEFEVVRFASAQALAYMGNSGGVEELGRLAELSTDYRPYALSALAALGGPAASLQLGRLFNCESAEARYGAFRSLWATDSRDPTIVGERLEHDFHLHCIESQAVPMVHLARNFRPEVVIFGSKQQLLTPLSLRAGDFILLNASAESDAVHLASFRPTGSAAGPRRGESSLVLADVIREAARLGASYGDIVEMLEQAAANGNLMGRLEINALPRAMSLETLQAVATSEKVSRPKVTEDSAPGLFTVIDPENRPKQDGPLVDVESEAAAADAAKSKPEKKGFFRGFRRLAN